MKIIISPAKKMTADNYGLNYKTNPIYIKEAQQVLSQMKKLSYQEAQKMWNCSDKLAITNYDLLQKINLNKNLMPAITSYVGIQYQYMSPDIFTDNALEYIQNNLRILSGFYGILRPFDGITPYRLSMDSDISVEGTKNLYQFWGNKIYDQLFKNDNVVINLASLEYSKIVTPYLKDNQKMIDIIFGEIIDGKVKVKATLAKMARGEMVRYMAENNVTDIDEIKKFDYPNYSFNDEMSDEKKLVFINNVKS